MGGLGISTSENRVTVTMDCNIDKIKKFNEKVTSSPFIKFEQSQGKPIGYSKEMSPSALTTSSYGTGSIGYIAKKYRNNRYCYSWACRTNSKHLVAI